MRSLARSWTVLLLAVVPAVALSSCGGGGAGNLLSSETTTSTTLPPRSTTTVPPSTTTSSSTTTTSEAKSPTPLAIPAALKPFGTSTLAGQGTWTAAGRPVNGVSAVYETKLIAPGSTQPAGIAWMDTRLLYARLYSGSRSPGGGPFRFTAPIQPAEAASVVAAFNGGFIMNVAHGGYFTEGRTIVPLVSGAASLVIYADGSVNIGAWGKDVSMTPNVVGVRQNLIPLVVNGQPSPQAATTDWLSWGATCGVHSCVGPGIEHQWRSGLGITADGALVYATGPALDPLQLAQLLVRAGAIRGMQLDINPYWTVFVTYDPSTPGGLASPANGSKLVASTTQGPKTFFESWWARDFITMSARSSTSG